MVKRPFFLYINASRESFIRCIILIISSDYAIYINECETMLICALFTCCIPSGVLHFPSIHSSSLHSNKEAKFKPTIKVLSMNLIFTPLNCNSGTWQKCFRRVIFNKISKIIAIIVPRLNFKSTRHSLLDNIYYIR